MYAIVRTGGKQYRVEAGRSLNVERLPAEEGETVELSDVLLIAEDGQVTVGSPTIEGARVTAEVAQQGRAKKIIVFKYKAKVRTRKKAGHRQWFTRLTVREILRPGQEPEEAKPTPARRRKKAAEEEPAEEETAVETPVVAETPAVAEEAKPKRRTRRKVAEMPVAETPAVVEEAKPKRRTRRKAAETPAAEAEAASGVAEATADAEAIEGEAKPKRRAPRRKKTEEME